MWRGPWENIAYEYVLTSPAVSCISCLSYLDVLVMGGKCPCSCCFVWCCFQDLFNMACSILVQLLSSFFTIRLVSVYVVHPSSSSVTIMAWKKLRFILSDRSDFHMIDNLLIEVHAFTSRILLSFWKITKRNKNKQIKKKTKNKHVYYILEMNILASE